MKLTRLSVYIILFLSLTINGCLCDSDSIANIRPCAEIDNVYKTITFEIHAKYHYNNEPIQNEGKVIITAIFSNWILYVNRDGYCEYNILWISKEYVKNLDENGNAIITIDEFEYDNKYDNLISKVQIESSNISKIESSAQHKNVVTKYNSPESIKLFFSIKTDKDL
jgi:hypothetical protein